MNQCPNLHPKKPTLRKRGHLERAQRVERPAFPSVFLSAAEYPPPPTYSQIDVIVIVWLCSRHTSVVRNGASSPYE